MSTQQIIDSPDSSTVTNSSGIEVTITNDKSFTTEESKKKQKPKKQPPTKSPTLAKDKPKELHAIGKFYAGVAELQVKKSDLELARTQRIIFEENGVHYEYTRIKTPY